jgi:hypothetical protein
MIRRRLALLVAVASLLLPACAKHDNGVDLGLKKVELNLSFKGKNAKAATPTLTDLLDSQAPYGPVVQAIGGIVGPIDSKITGPSILGACAKAPAGLLPEVPVDGVPLKAPTAGTYLTHIEGTYDLSGVLNLKGGLIPLGTTEIANVTDTSGKDEAGQAMRTVAYDVIVRNMLATTTTHYESITRDISRTNFAYQPPPIASELRLVWEKVAQTTGNKTEFHPTPPLTIMQYGGEGADWTSAGVDQDTHESRVVQGTIAKREAVDVCGKMVDTFRVESMEHVVIPEAQYRSQTNGVGNVYNIATQFGGLLVRSIIDTTTDFNLNGASEELNLKYTTTINSTSPAAVPKF